MDKRTVRILIIGRRETWLVNLLSTIIALSFEVTHIQVVDTEQVVSFPIDSVFDKVFVLLDHVSKHTWFTELLQITQLYGIGRVVCFAPCDSTSKVEVTRLRSMNIVVLDPENITHTDLIAGLNDTLSPCTAEHARVIKAGPVTLSLDMKSLRVEGSVSQMLSEREVGLLSLLMSHPGTSYKVDRLIEHVWLDEQIDEARVKETIERLQKALGQAPQKPHTGHYILDGMGMGTYTWNAPEYPPRFFR